MKTKLITPCPNTGEDLYGKKKHLESEFKEFSDAWNEWENDQGDRKKLAHMVEEAIDVATSCMTFAEEAEKKSGIPALVDHTLLMVAAKTYIRGYHKRPII